MNQEFARAAHTGDLTTLQWMLWEDRRSATSGEGDDARRTTLLLALQYLQLPVAQWLLEHGGAKLTNKYGYSAWDHLRDTIPRRCHPC